MHSEGDEKFEIIVGVLSARDNFIKRQTIRDTWWKHVSSNETLSRRIDLKFVVGSTPCEIPIPDRTDPYTCAKYDLAVPAQNKDILAAKETPREDGVWHDWNFAMQTLSFKVHHPVILSKLGIHTDSLQHKLTVRLLDAASQTEIVSTVLSRETPGVLLEGFRYKAVEPYLLPQGFEGLIVSERSDSAALELPVTSRPVDIKLTDSGGVLEFLPPRLEPTHDGHYTDPKSGGANIIAISSFIFSIHESEKLEAFIKNENRRNEEWLDLIDKNQEALMKESSQYEDILFVNMVDVYRHVPLKLVRFYQWISQERDFELAMKTDDDCFVDIERLLVLKARYNISTQRIWWGRFRQAWAVDHHGKWAELQYPSIAYPSFACGSGSLLSADIVRWVAQNSDSLNMFQGEDVSLGIWMAALSPQLIDDPLFQCEKQCIRDMVTLPDLSQQEMIQIWEDRQTCGDPCGCN